MEKEPLSNNIIKKPEHEPTVSLQMDNNSGEADFLDKEEKQPIVDESPVDEENQSSSFQNSFHYVDREGNNIPAPGDDDFDENNAALPFVVDEWAQGTSIHGVPYVTDALTWKLWKRVLWIILVLMSSSFMIWQISTLISQYRDYEVITDTETINPPSLEFPEITVCTTNAFSQWRMNATGIDDPSTEEELMEISRPVNETFIFSLYNFLSFEVIKASWRPVIVNNFGLCWQFNTSVPITRAGYWGGLHLWADLQQYDFDQTTEFASLIVFAQPAGTLITDRMPFYSINPGKNTLLNLRLSKFHRERQAPWARCHSESPQYTQSGCQAKCVEAKMRDECGCRRYGDLAPEAQSVRYCLRFDQTDEDCQDLVWANETAIVDECNCEQPPCNENLYSGTITDATLADVWLDSFDYELHGVDRPYLEKNIVALTINFDQLQYNLLTESKAVTFAQLLGSIGGSMGFFLGISMVSVIELVGDLTVMRLIPRLFGYRNLLGLGARKSH